MQGSKKSTQDMEIDIDIESSVGLVNSLREIFSVSEKFIGKAIFSRSIKKFLSRLGKKLPKTANKTLVRDFVDFNQHYSPMVRLPQRREVLLFEHLLHQVNIGPGNLPLNYLDMAKALTEMGDSVIFHLPKGSFLLNCQFPIIELYQAIKNNKELTKPKFQKSRNYFIILWKQDNITHCEYLDDGEYNLLTLLDPYKPFVSIYDKFCQLHNKSLNDRLLPGLCMKGYINRFTLAKNSIN